MQYFVVMIDYGRRGREAVVDPEITRREVIARIVSGEYKNVSFIHEIADLITAQAPNARKVVIPDAGHHPNMEHPELFEQVVREFLAAHA